MNCPLCIDETLQPTYRGGIEIDICPRCKGIWLDRGELERLAAAPGQPAPSVGKGAVRVEPTSRERDASSKPQKKKSKKKQKSLSERLGDVLEDVLDF